MQILVTGGTGTVGSQVVTELLARKPGGISVLTRDAKKAQNLPEGVTGVQGDMGDIDDVRRIFKGFDAVFLVNVVSPTESSEGLNAVTQMRLEGVKRIVYLSVHKADAAAWLPHFGSKVGIEEALRRSGIPFTILRPSNFHQNDSWFKDVILQHGVYPQPFGTAGVARVDVRDIAEAAAIALTTSDHEGESYDLVGPANVTAPWTAEIWSKVLGKPIQYGGNDLDAWEKVNLQYMPKPVVFDFKEMYRFFQTEGLTATSEDVARVTKLLGHPPRSFESFAEETAKVWTSTAR